MGNNGESSSTKFIDLPWYLRARNTASAEFIDFLEAMNRASLAAIADPANKSLWVKFVETFDYRSSMYWLGESRPDAEGKGDGGLGYAIRYALESFLPQAEVPTDIIISHSNLAFSVEHIDEATQDRLAKACVFEPEHDERIVKQTAHRLYRLLRSEDLSDLYLQEYIRSAIQTYAFRPSAGISTDPW